MGSPSVLEQQEKLADFLNALPSFRKKVDLKGAYDKMHTRFAYFSWHDGAELLCLLDRGFDILKPGTERARADTAILKFVEIDPQMRTILKLPNA